MADKEGAVVVVASATGLFNHSETINEHPLKVIILERGQRGLIGFSFQTALHHSMSPGRIIGLAE